MKKKITFYISIASLVIIIVCVLTGLHIVNSHRASSRAAMVMADRLFDEITGSIVGKFSLALGSVTVLTNSGATMPSLAKEPEYDALSHGSLDYLIKSAVNFNYISSSYIGYSSGNFLQLIAVRGNPDILETYQAPVGTEFIVRSIIRDNDDNRKQYWRYLDKNRNVLSETSEDKPTYDPRKRSWYQKGLAQNKSVFTEPYVFSSSQKTGITCSHHLINREGVFAVDITLDSFSRFLKEQKVSRNGTLFLFDDNARMIAHPSEDTVQKVSSENGKSQDRIQLLKVAESSDPVVRSATEFYYGNPEAEFETNFKLTIQGTPWLVRMSNIGADYGINMIISIAAPVSDFTGHIQQMEIRIFLFSMLLLLLIIPLIFWASRKISRALVLLAREAEKVQNLDFSDSEPFDSAIKEIHVLIDVFSLMKVTIRKKTADLITAQKEIEILFNSFIKLLAGAIDAKSPYTGGHCTRVPELAAMIAKEVHNSEEGPFQEFRLNSEDEWREFRVAAWLHDCGKITTPEFVVDKSTKLQTIYNRIHEIRTRFEVLYRDAELDYYRKLVTGEYEHGGLEKELAVCREKLTDDFLFIAECNIGGEFMSDDKVNRLIEIASRKWTRYFDNRIGLSQDELKNYKKKGLQESLPIEETLLSDKPEHVTDRDQKGFYKDTGFGFKMDIPKARFNCGEIYNLSIRKGTLTDEERFKINEHVIQTIVMLNELPFPKSMSNVSEIAGSHHETMIGNGYPRRLKKEDMSVKARIMAIADIFEALTASDRPYKKAKTLNDALKIMSFMRNDNHIDPDLFNLFLTSGVYSDYAGNYLKKEQVDTVDIQQYMRVT